MPPPPWIDGSAWLEALSGALARRPGALPFGASPWTDPQARRVRVARARWALLALLGLYGVFAGAVFSLSEVGFFPSLSQVAALVLSVAGVAVSNLLLLSRQGEDDAQARRMDRVQVLLDLIFITVLIHVSGGAASWFWPAYLLVTIEAALLLPQEQDVWRAGAIGGLLYGLLLGAHHLDLLPQVLMPFSSPSLHGNALHLALLWSWVAILNAAAAMISAHLMSVIRWEHESLADREGQLREFIESAHDLIACLSPDGRFHYVNPQWLQVVGHDLEALKETTFFDLIDLEHRARTLKEFRAAMAEGRGTSIEAEFLTRTGQRIAVEGNIVPAVGEGHPAMAWCICRDVTIRKQAEEQLFRLAHYDPLTGLPNRALLMERLAESRTRAQAQGRHLAVLFVDLDRFKLINDTLGHGVGDDLLRAVAGRIQAAVRDSDTVCRLGGDEFIVTLGNVADRKEAASLAARILKPLARPFRIGPHEVFVTASAGISLYPEDGTSLEDLLKKADIAMYQAKAQGRNNQQFYHRDQDGRVERRLLLAGAIRRALEAEELRVVYQPKVEVASGRITALEALVRWEHPELGLILPSEFIPLAEESGMILPLGEWVLREACLAGVRWRDAGLPRVRLGVNLSGYQLQQPDLADVISRVLASTGFEPGFLELEITETVVMQNPKVAMEVLDRIQALGIEISIDDFGTGHSSLAQLKRFAVNTLKIDKCFIRDLEHNPTDAAIATAIIAMGACLHLQVVAEGVETEGQLAFLRDRACHGAQGFLFSRPVEPEAVAQLLEGQSLLVEGSVA